MAHPLQRAASVTIMRFFKLTPTEGKGTGETFRQFTIHKGDYIIADRGYCHATGIDHVHRQSAYVTVRLNPASVRILTTDGKPFPLAKNLRAIRRPGIVKSWDVQISGQTEPVIAGRLCVVHKSQEAIALAQKKLRRRANKHGEELQPQKALSSWNSISQALAESPRARTLQLSQFYEF